MILATSSRALVHASNNGPQFFILFGYCLFLAIMAESVFASHYDTLGIQKTASPSEVKKAFHRKARDTHPDKNPNKEAEALFRDVTTAYEILSDERSRTMYDLELVARSSKHNQKQPRRTVVFTHNGRTYFWNEEDVRGFGFQQRSQHDSIVASVVQHIMLFIGIWLLVRTTSDSRASSGRTHASEDNEGRAVEETTENSTSFPSNEVASAHAPHVHAWKARYFRQKNRRCVVFFPRDPSCSLEWKLYESIALNFMTDRLSFVYVDLNQAQHWAQFLRAEFPDSRPLVCVIGSSGTKANSFVPSGAHEITLTGPLRDHIVRWLESVVEGTAPFRLVENDLPAEGTCESNKNPE